MSNREPNDLDSYSDYIDGPDEDMTGLLRDPDEDRDDLEERINEAEYRGDLIADCKAVEALGKSLEAKLSAPLPEGLFEKARRLNAEQEQQCNGFYSNRANGGQY